MRPLISLTTTLDPLGGDYRKPRVGIYANYLHAVQRAGLTPSLVSPAHDMESVEALVRATSGLILSGGEDVDPSRYGEEPMPQLGEVNPRRDLMEWRALDVALELDMPVLGICRGMQLINVHMGGTLYQDLATQRPDLIKHLQDAPWGHHHHRVQCTEGSNLQRIFGDCMPLEINSFHHQAVKDLAPGVRCTAQAEDGLIEGIESERHRWVVGVQWHPERHEADAPHDDPNLRILESFAAAAREYEEA
jgi:putative glutamine amidotransferase